MEPKPASASIPNPEPPVVEPPANITTDSATAAGPETKTEPTDKPEAESKPAVPPAKTQIPKAPKKPGVTAAIFATVVIVLGLAALAVVAYLKNPK